MTHPFPTFLSPLPRPYSVAVCPFPESGQGFCISFPSRIGGRDTRRSIAIREGGKERGKACPNPFNPDTKIRFSVHGFTGPEEVSIRLYDLRGKLVRTVFSGRVRSGSYAIIFDAMDNSRAPLSAGIYLCSLTAGNFYSRQKIILAK